MKKLSVLLALGILLFACSKNDDPTMGEMAAPTLPDQPYDYTTFDVQSEFGWWVLNPEPSANQLSDDGATLGRVLFYDTKLSVNNRTACGSCHSQRMAFADGLQASEGFKTATTPRNSMSICNLELAPAYFWDMRAQSLEEQVLMPVANHIEMGVQDFDALEEKLAQFDYYPPLFEAAFGSPEVTTERISMALAQFLRSMRSTNSKFDRAEAEFNNFASLSPQERRGRELFMEELHCASCHSGPNFSGWNANIGLDMEYEDKGMGHNQDTGQLPESNGADGVFKVPSLRNVALTAPYMHDGRFQTLREVVEHYNSGVQAHPNLDWRMLDNDFLLIDFQGPFFPSFPTTNTSDSPRKLNLSESDKDALVAFLQTLTDEEFTHDERFSNPFVQ